MVRQAREVRRRIGFVGQQASVDEVLSGRQNLEMFGQLFGMDRVDARRRARELLDAATALGVEFIPCQMSMDMFGIKREDLIDGMGEPAGAATAIEIMTEANASLFI